MVKLVKLEKQDLIDNPLKDLSKDNKITLQQILNNLLDGKENLELKSHIFKPKALAGLKSLSNYLEVLDYPKSSAIITAFIRNYLEYMVSYKRLSRIEIIKAFTYSNRVENNKEGFNSNLE